MFSDSLNSFKIFYSFFSTLYISSFEKIITTQNITGLVDEQQKVRTITALAIAALAEAATPYGIESFDSVLKPLWKGIRTHRGKGLAAFLKAIGYLIPLMDAEYANYYTREVMLILIREFQSPDEEMKKIVLKVRELFYLSRKYQSRT